MTDTISTTVAAPYSAGGRRRRGRGARANGFIEGCQWGLVSYHSCCYELLSISQDYMSGYLGRWTTAREYAILDIPVDDNEHLEFWRK